LRIKRVSTIVFLTIILLSGFVYFFYKNNEVLIAYYSINRNKSTQSISKVITVQSSNIDSLHILNLDKNDSAIFQYTIPIKVDSVWQFGAGWLTRNCTINQTWDNFDKANARIKALRKYDTIVSGISLNDCYSYQVFGFYQEEDIINTNYSVYIDYCFDKQIVIREQKYFGDFLKYEKQLDSIKYTKLKLKNN